MSWHLHFVLRSWRVTWNDGLTVAPCYGACPGQLDIQHEWHANEPEVGAAGKRTLAERIQCPQRETGSHQEQGLGSTGSRSIQLAVACLSRESPDTGKVGRDKFLFSKTLANYRQRYLWPAYTEDAPNYLIVLIATFVGVKQRAHVPIWGESLHLVNLMALLTKG
jgi:hypothetical protein